MVEFIVRLVLRPDLDRVHGLKYAFQSFQQALIMFLAAMTTTGYLDSDFGQNICILLSIIQVWLAIPEQIFGLVMMTFLHKKGIDGDADLKESEKELVAQLRMDEVTVTDKIVSVKFIAMKFKEKIMLFQSEGIHSFIVSIISDRKLLLCVNILNPGSVNRLLQSVFCSKEVIGGLKSTATTFSPLDSLILDLLKIQWLTSVDFLEGMEILHLIQDTIESFIEVLKYLSESNYTRALGIIIASRGILTVLNKSNAGTNLSTKQNVSILQKFFHHPVVRSKLATMKEAKFYHNQKDMLICILDFPFACSADLDNYLSLLEEWCCRGLLKTHTGLLEQHSFSCLSTDLAESLGDSTALEFLNHWKCFVPEPWHKIYCNLLDASSHDANQSCKPIIAPAKSAIGVIDLREAAQHLPLHLQNTDGQGAHPFNVSMLETAQTAIDTTSLQSIPEQTNGDLKIRPVPSHEQFLGHKIKAKHITIRQLEKVTHVSQVHKSSSAEEFKKFSGQNSQEIKTQPSLLSSSKTSPRDDPASRMISRHFVSRHSSETDPALGDQMQYSTTSTHGARVPQACCVNNNLRTTIVP